MVFGCWLNICWCFHWYCFFLFKFCFFFCSQLLQLWRTFYHMALQSRSAENFVVQIWVQLLMMWPELQGFFCASHIWTSEVSSNSTVAFAVAIFTWLWNLVVKRTQRPVPEAVKTYNTLLKCNPVKMLWTQVIPDSSAALSAGSGSTGSACVFSLTVVAHSSVYLFSAFWSFVALQNPMVLYRGSRRVDKRDVWLAA